MGTDETSGDAVAVYRPPGRPGLQFEKVKMAADELLREGSRPTVEKIRAKVGGSPNTIIEHLDKWWASLAERIEVGSEAFLRLPRSYAHFAESFFHQSMEEFRKLAQAEAGSQVEDATRKTEETRQRTLLLDERERELAEAIADRDQRIAALESALAERSSQLLVLRAEQQSMFRRVSKLTSELRRTHERLLLSPIPGKTPRPRASRVDQPRPKYQRARRIQRAKSSTTAMKPKRKNPRLRAGRPNPNQEDHVRHAQSKRPTHR